MNYLEIEMGGKARGLKFTQATYAEIVAKNGDSTNPYFGFYCMVWAGMVVNCQLKEIPQDFTFEQVGDWCDQMSDEDALRINEAYKSTIEFRTKLKEDTDKKKLSAETNTEQNASALPAVN